MEYPMITLITGERSLRSLVGVTVHEMAQLFKPWWPPTKVYTSGWTRGSRRGQSRVAWRTSLPTHEASEDPHGWAYASYIRRHLSGNEEP